MNITKRRRKGNMLAGLIQLYLILILVGYSSAYSHERICYGSGFELPSNLAPWVYKGEIYFIPTGGEKRLVVNNGRSLDPRFQVSLHKIYMPDLTEEDEGAISALTIGELFSLSIVDCEDPEIRNYHNIFSWTIPHGAEYFQFTPLFSKLPVVLWNRTGPSNGRGTVNIPYYEIHDLTQKDSGYYRFRGYKNQLLKWTKLVVKEYTEHLSYSVGDHHYMEYPFSSVPWRIKFDADENNYTMGGDVPWRVQFKDHEFIIENVGMRDAGTYKFFDDEGNLIMQLKLKVTDYVPVWVYVVVISALIVGMILCCCCVKKCQSTKKSNKRSNPAPEVSDPPPEPVATAPVAPAGPPVYYHGMTTIQPSGSIYSAGPPTSAHSSQPVGPTAPVEPTVTSLDPPSYNSVFADMSPLPPEYLQATDPPDLGPCAVGFNTEPRFEVKGMAFSSAPLLSSDTSTSGVFTSQKLDFL